MSDPMNEVTWAKSLLGRMGYDVNRNNVTALVAWQYAEGGHHANDARYNPLNTTRDSKLNGGDYPSVNSHGVCSYPNRDVGLDKTVETLKLPAYAGIRKDLERGAPPATTLGAVVASPWGTSSLATDAGVLARAKDAVADRKDVTSDRPGGGAKSDAPAGSTKVVLDLHELRRLDRTYRAASDEIVRHRQVVGDIAADLRPALAALQDKGLATVIGATFDWLLAPSGGLDADARQHDRLSQLTGGIRRLAEEADADHNGRWSRGEAMAFATEHQGESGAALAAVTPALAGGTIVKRGAKPEGGSASGGGSGSGGGGGSRSERVKKMLEFAQTQKATDGGTNTTKYNAWYGAANGQPWCAMFVSYVFAKSGDPLPAMQTSHTGFAHCHYAIAYAREHGQLDSVPQVGDIFIRKDEQHTGIVSKVNADGSFETVEGNAGPNTDRVWHGRRENDGQYWFWTAIR